MKTLPGRPLMQMVKRQLEQYIGVMAEFHRLGAIYEPRVYAKSRNVYRYFQEAREDLENAAGLSSKRQKLLDYALTYTHEGLEPLKTNNTLTKTHIHGNFRLCHVLFEGRSVSGIIDAEHAEYAERVFEVCLGLVSHVNPARCLLLNLDGILVYLRQYDQLYPFTGDDCRTLKTMLLFALLNELSGALLFLGTGQSEALEVDVEKLWMTLGRVAKLPDDLGLPSR